jgi:hypothetical protein
MGQNGSASLRNWQFFGRIRWLMARPANHIPTDRERGVLQSLIEGQWLLAAELHPAVPSTIFVMIGKGWIERKQYAAVSKYRITASGRAALKQ